ncbi:MAG: bifunctional 3-hydroxydecanoyl-ACP dehydratase/trans-2-decenoyl-ACP isomerase, partial [Proteobacteria bacterium]
PHNKVVRYEIDIKRLSNMAAQDAAIAIGSAKVFVDDQEIYTINDAKAGICKNIQYRDYPHESEHSIGGKLT